MGCDSCIVGVLILHRVHHTSTPMNMTNSPFDLEYRSASPPNYDWTRCMKNTTAWVCQMQIKAKLAYDTPWTMCTEPFEMTSCPPEEPDEVPVMVPPTIGDKMQRAWLRFKPCDKHTFAFDGP